MLTPFGNTPNANSYDTYGATLGSGNSFLLDKVGGAKLAVSVRKLSALYQGGYARLRRGNDNLETDITNPYGGFVSPKAVTENGQSIEDWLQNNQGTGVKWHDQSGGSLHLTQTTANLQFILKDNFSNYRSAFAGTPLGDYQWNYPNGINNYLYGANKQFTFHFVLKSNITTSTDFSMFYHLNSNVNLVKGLVLRISDGGTGSRYKAGFIGGDLTSSISLNTVNSFDKTQANMITVRYDGTITTSWADRVQIAVNGINQVLAQVFQAGPFPAYLTQPTNSPRCLAPFTSVVSSGLSEVIFWDKCLSDTEVNFLTLNTKKAFGI